MPPFVANKKSSVHLLPVMGEVNAARTWWFLGCVVYKRQLFFQYSCPSGCDTSKSLSDDFKNKLYYDGFQKMLDHYSHQPKERWIVKVQRSFGLSVPTLSTKPLTTYIEQNRPHSLRHLGGGSRAAWSIWIIRRCGVRQKCKPYFEKNWSFLLQYGKMG